MSRKIYPNFYDCQECEHWDDVNGCWGGYDEFCGRSFDHEDCEEDEE